jgi:hypothetical protein
MQGPPSGPAALPAQGEPGPCAVSEMLVSVEESGHRKMTALPLLAPWARRHGDPAPPGLKGAVREPPLCARNAHPAHGIPTGRKSQGQLGAFYKIFSCR